MLTSLISRVALGAFWNAWKWKIVLAGAAAVGVYIGALNYQLNSARSNLRVAEMELAVAQDANAANAAAISELEAANAEWAKAVGANKERMAALEKDADNAKRNAERAQRDLEARRRADRESTDCAALLDRSFAVCPDVGRRLRERQAALGENGDR